MTSAVDTIATHEMSLDRHFRAMACGASVSVVIDDHGRGRVLVDRAIARVAHLERCWSRFRDDSDVSAINRAEGRTVMVDPSTIELVRAMVIARKITDGSCDPAYRSEIESSTIDLGRVWFDVDRNLVRVPAGVILDPGSIGKGLAADLVAAQLVAGGARGALVEIGGDIRVAGEGPHHGMWAIDVPDPFDRIDCGGTVLIGDGGVATSGLSIEAQRGLELDGPENVSVDPVTRRPLESSAHPVVSATVIAGSAAEAEAWSTALLVDGENRLGEVQRRGGLARVVRSDGTTRSTDEWATIMRKNEVRDV
jgi:thiamine biosynthesis lipoprotein